MLGSGASQCSQGKGAVNQELALFVAERAVHTYVAVQSMSATCIGFDRCTRKPEPYNPTGHAY